MAIVSACIQYYSKNFDSCVPPTPNDLFSVILPRDKTYDIGLDQSSSCTGIAIRSIDGDLEMIVDVRNNSFNKNTFYRELKGVLRKLVNERNIRLVVCEDPIPAKLDLARASKTSVVAQSPSAASAPVVTQVPSNEGNMNLF